MEQSRRNGSSLLNTNDDGTSTTLHGTHHEKTSAADSDPYVFGPPGFGSFSQRYGYLDSGYSVSSKPLIPTVI